MTSRIRVMTLIEVPLNSYRYHFRRLVWQEEARLKFPKGEDQRRIILSTALVDISGLKVTRQEALSVLKKLPEAILWRIWLIYRGSLPEERYYTSTTLFEAPDVMTYQKKLHEDETVADPAQTRIENQFGKNEVAESQDVTRQMFRAAKASGTLVPARGESSVG
jgi:hypothetical protein